MILIYIKNQKRINCWPGWTSCLCCVVSRKESN